jgi:hypothetical protein
MRKPGTVVAGVGGGGERLARQFGSQTASSLGRSGDGVLVADGDGGSQELGQAVGVPVRSTLEGPALDWRTPGLAIRRDTRAGMPSS